MAIFGTLFLYSVIAALIAVRKKNIKQHQAWMSRAYAIGSSIVTMRLIFLPLIFGLGVESNEQAALYSIISFISAFIIHLFVAEWWIREQVLVSTHA